MASRLKKKKKTVLPTLTISKPSGETHLEIGKGELFSKFKTKLGYLPHFLKARHCLKKSKQKMSAYLGCEYFKTERAGNSSCSYLSKKVVDILISY